MTIKETTQPDAYVIGQITGELMYSTDAPEKILGRIREALIAYYETTLERSQSFANELKFSREVLERLTK